MVSPFWRDQTVKKRREEEKREEEEEEEKKKRRKEERKIKKVWKLTLSMDLWIFIWILTFRIEICIDLYEYMFVGFGL